MFHNRRGKASMKKPMGRREKKGKINKIAKKNTHTHTHTHINIYIWIYPLPFSPLPFIQQLFSLSLCFPLPSFLKKKRKKEREKNMKNN